VYTEELGTMLSIKSAFHGQAQQDLFLYTLQYLMPEDVRALYEQEPDSQIKSYLRQDNLWQILHQRIFPDIKALREQGQDSYDFFWKIYEKLHSDIPPNISRLFSLARAREAKQLIDMLRMGTIRLDDFMYLDSNYVPFDYYIRDDEEFTKAAFAIICEQRKKLGLKSQQRDPSGQELIHWAVRFDVPMPIFNELLQLYDNNTSEPSINYTCKVPQQRLEAIKPRVHPNHTTYFITPFYIALLFKREEAIQAFITAHGAGQYKLEATIAYNRPLIIGTMPLSVSTTYESSHLGSALRFNHQHVFNRLLKTDVPIPVVFNETIYGGALDGMLAGLNPVTIAVEFKRYRALDDLLPRYRNIEHLPHYIAIKSNDLELLIQLLPYTSKQNLDNLFHRLRFIDKQIINPIADPIIKTFLDCYINFLKNDLMTIFKNISSELGITSSDGWFSLFNKRKHQLTAIQLRQSAAINELYTQCQYAKEHLAVPFNPSLDMEPLTTAIPHFDQFLSAFQDIFAD
jgi:hypothetical protein